MARLNCAGDLSGTVEDAVTRCAAAVQVTLAEAVLDAQQSAELVVLDHHGNTLYQQVLNPIEPTPTPSVSLNWR
ncbi:hypothetical protein E5720_17645 [Rhodococcus sp. PAMC28707]|uniref:hypothetical protein n=1 Tax=unclassified Rhodococcus (in: high G+C Gram-positive bacteria) TaxID=192944 RepID=UPI00109DE748|nr:MULTISPECIES: hypothetical protein [unclassified Rhodococcus (in: high G+C Gram-positive bacteria)]QCB51793.1 hypothetical protein E5769_17880 [Rhodococcus sp. PAMC28705]QCB60039.1 hypothetical protein E5720_17645 [Rhodococcus sp. PAMC28707]